VFPTDAPHRGATSRKSVPESLYRYGRPLMHRVPKLRIHRSKRLAYVCLDGRQVYLGRAHSPEAQARYAALLADLRVGTASGRALEPVR